MNKSGEQTSTSEYYAPFRSDKFRCFDCGEHFGGYMVKTPVWREVLRQDRRIRFLCLPCLVKRIGRDITVDDLSDAPVNDALKYVFGLCRACP